MSYNPFDTNSVTSQKKPLLDPEQGASVASSVYSSLPEEHKAAVRDAAYNEAKNQAKSASSKEYGKLKNWINGGPIGLRVLCFFAGIACVVGSGVSIFINFASLKLFSSIGMSYVVLFGLIIAAIEVKGILCSSWIKKYLDREVHFLSTAVGRGNFYFFVGSLLIGDGEPWNLATGIVLMCCAVLSWIVYRSTNASLDSLKKKMAMDGDIKRRFDEYDGDKDGCIDSKEFIALCASFDISFSSNELEEAMRQLDRGDTNKISFESFVQWWSSN